KPQRVEPERLSPPAAFSFTQQTTGHAKKATSRQREGAKPPAPAIRGSGAAERDSREQRGTFRDPNREGANPCEIELPPSSSPPSRSPRRCRPRPHRGLPRCRSSRPPRSR